MIEQISEMDDILFTLLSIYDLRGMSIEEALSRQISKHEYRQSKGYDYFKKKYPNEYDYKLERNVVYNDIIQSDYEESIV